MDKWMHGQQPPRQGRNQKLFRGLFSSVLSFVYFPLSFPFFCFRPSKWSLSPSNPAKGFGGAPLAPQAGRTTFAAMRHVPWVLNTPKVYFS